MSTVKEAAVKRGTSKGVGFFIGGLLVSIAIMFLVFWYMGRLAGFDKEYTGYAGEQQVLSQRIAKYTLEASSGSKEAFEQVTKYRDRFGQTLSYLRSGNVATDLPPTTGDADKSLKDTEAKWGTFSESVNAVLTGKDLVLLLSEAVSEKINLAVNTLVSDLGMLCDGAKGGCALKVVSSTESAIRAAYMALNSHGITEEEGFVGRSAEETIKNMSRISEIGMSLVDETMLGIMLAKKQ